jgi:hypothetical protein
MKERFERNVGIIIMLIAIGLVLYGFSKISIIVGLFAAICLWSIITVIISHYSDS